MRRLLLSVWMLVALATSVAAQAPEYEVRAVIHPPTGITSATQFELIIDISGGLNPRIGAIDVDGMDNIQVIRSTPFTSRSTQNNNGVVSSNFRLSYGVRALGPGPARVPPLTIEIDGKSYRTDPIEFTVQEPPKAPDRPSDPRGGTGEARLFAVPQLSADEVWLGEPLISTMQVYSTLPTSRAGLIEAPEYGQFQAFELNADLTASRAELQGQLFEVRPLRTDLLIPLTTGELTIEPVPIQVAVRSTRSAFDLWSRGRNVRIDSDPKTVTVKPLPGGAPSGFGGAVGQFRMQARLDRGESTVNDVVALKVTVEGAGSLRTVDPPSWEPPAGVQVYDPKIDLNREIRNGNLYSTKSWEWAIVPLAPGELEIPDLEFSFFDTKSGSYRTVRAEPLELEVAEGDDLASPLPANPGERGVMTLDRQDISYIRELGDRPLTRPSAPLHQRAWFLSLAFAPLFWMPFLIWIGRRRDLLEQDLGLARNRKARKRARKSLLLLKKQGDGGDSAAFYEEVARALVAYVGDRFNRAPSGLTYDLAEELLAGKGVDEALRRRFRSCLETCDFARFVPASSQPQRRDEVLTEALELIDQLERAW